MKVFKCMKCKINLCALKCKEKRCGKCCLDQSCRGHSRKYLIINETKKIEPNPVLSESSTDDSDTEMKYDDKNIKAVEKIMYNTTYFLLPTALQNLMPTALQNLIIMYIDNRPMCHVCECYCEPNLVSHCQNCNELMCNNCSNDVYICRRINCWFCKFGCCVDGWTDKYCEFCYFIRGMRQTTDY